MTIRLAFDWVGAPPSADSLAQSTMAALTIDVDGTTVTSVLDVLDRRSRSCRNHVVTSLGHVAQWLVANWWRLFHEVADSRTPRSDFAEARDFACIGEGYLLPSLTIAPTPERCFFVGGRTDLSTVHWSSRKKAKHWSTATSLKLHSWASWMSFWIDSPTIRRRSLCARSGGRSKRRTKTSASSAGRRHCSVGTLSPRLEELPIRSSPSGTAQRLPFARTPWPRQTDRALVHWPTG